jgi:hypothetical protein
MFWVSGTSLEIKLGLDWECWQVHHKLNNREENSLKRKGRRGRRKNKSWEKLLVKSSRKRANSKNKWILKLDRHIIVGGVTSEANLTWDKNNHLKREERGKMR